jgi:hypothetical protein
MKLMAEKLKEKNNYMESGVVSLETFLEYKKTGKTPEAWSGGVSGHNIITVDEKHIEDLSKLEKMKVTHVRMRWPRPVETCAPGFFRYLCLMEEIKEKNDYGDHHRPTDDDVRLVFGFDS